MWHNKVYDPVLNQFRQATSSKHSHAKPSQRNRRKQCFPPSKSQIWLTKMFKFPMKWSDIRWKLCIRNRLWNESHFRPRNKSSKKITPVLPRAGGLRGCFNGIKCILWYSTQYLTIGISYHCSIPNAIYPRAKKPRGEGHEKTLQRHWQWWTTGKNILWTILQLLL